MLLTREYAKNRKNPVQNWHFQSLKFLKHFWIVRWTYFVAAIVNNNKIKLLTHTQLKVAFFQKVRCVFQISKSQTKIFRKTILSLKFKFPANNSKVFLAGSLNFKFSIVFWNIFFWRFEKRIGLSEKEPPLGIHLCSLLINILFIRKKSGYNFSFNFFSKNHFLNGNHIIWPLLFVKVEIKKNNY